MQYSTILHKNNFESTTSVTLRTREGHSYLALTGELWVSFVSYIEDKDREISIGHCIGQLTANLDVLSWDEIVWSNVLNIIVREIKHSCSGHVHRRDLREALFAKHQDVCDTAPRKQDKKCENHVYDTWLVLIIPPGTNLFGCLFQIW